MKIMDVERVSLDYSGMNIVGVNLARLHCRCVNVAPIRSFGPLFCPADNPGMQAPGVNIVRMDYIGPNDIAMDVMRK